MVYISVAAIAVAINNKVVCNLSICYHSSVLQMKMYYESVYCEYFTEQIMDKIPQEYLYIVLALLGVFISRTFLRYTRKKVNKF